MKQTFLRCNAFDRIDIERGDNRTWLDENHFIHRTKGKICLKSMYFLNSQNRTLISEHHFDKKDMACMERESFDTFSDFMAQIVEKYGKLMLQDLDGDRRGQNESRR